uniref:KIB1-4 beta-propeller domain-containing protein n=1 Tax=Oryza brachyantha TaxID=4533 RepID=J3MQ44_ORYBR
MLFPEGHGLYPGHGKLRGFVRFFNLSTGAFARVRLPTFKDHCVLYSVEGILLLQRDHGTAICLLHPFTGDILDFPPLDTMLRYVSSLLVGDKWYRLRDIRVASINVRAGQAVSLMIFSQGMMQIAFATSGEQQWKVSSWCFNQYVSPLPFQGKLYVVHHYAQIDPPQLEGPEPWLPPPRLITKCPACTPQATFCYHLVECDTVILLVSLRVGVDYHGINRTSVYRLADLMLGRTVRVTYIGGNALFMGFTNLCVRSKAFPTVVGDTIVFFDHHYNYLAPYHLSSGTSLPAPSDGSISTREFAIPSPFSIIYHIYTCCYRDQWNKGQIRFGGGGSKGWRVKRKWR